MKYLLTLALGLFLVSTFAVADKDRLFIESAVVNGDGTVTLPLFEGQSNGKTLWFIITDVSDGALANDLGVNRARKLDNARGTGAVQVGAFDSDGVLHVTASVDFDLDRVVVPDPVTGFPPLEASPGSAGEDGYSPLVELPDGTILNAPHIANDSGTHDKVVAMDFTAGTVTLILTDGFARNNAVIYISTDASDPTAAALEGATYAPALNFAPFVGGDGTNSSRASLAAITNGQTGIDNPERQGLNSALFGEGDPLNMQPWLPNQGRYSPLWDVHLSTWAAGETPTLQTDFFDVEDLADDGRITAPDDGPWGPSGFIVNCPIVTQLDD